MSKAKLAIVAGAAVLAASTAIVNTCAAYEYTDIAVNDQAMFDAMKNYSTTEGRILDYYAIGDIVDGNQTNKNLIRLVPRDIHSLSFTCTNAEGDYFNPLANVTDFSFFDELTSLTSVELCEEINYDGFPEGATITYDSPIIRAKADLAEMGVQSGTFEVTLTDEDLNADGFDYNNIAKFQEYAADRGAFGIVSTELENLTFNSVDDLFTLTDATKGGKFIGKIGGEDYLVVTLKLAGEEEIPADTTTPAEEEEEEAPIEDNIDNPSTFDAGFVTAALLGSTTAIMAGLFAGKSLRRR